jgi:DNA-binding phage protein
MRVARVARKQLCDADTIELAKTDEHVAKFLREALGKDDKQLVGALGRIARSKLALAQGMHFSLRSVG